MHFKMQIQSFISMLILISYLITCCECSEQNIVEARGKKKKKIAIFVYLADLVLKKFFFLKLAYAFVFWIILHKAGYFLAWFASYLKEQKHQHHDHHDHPQYDYHPTYSHGPYRRQNYGKL